MKSIDAVFVGLGYIGLPTAAFAASKGLNVLGVDVNPHVVDTINISCCCERKCGIWSIKGFNNS